MALTEKRGQSGSGDAVPGGGVLRAVVLRLPAVQEHLEEGRQSLADLDSTIGVGAVNCEKQKQLCVSFALKKYPRSSWSTGSMACGKSSRERHDAESRMELVKARSIAAEWRLMAQSNVTRLDPDVGAFEQTVLRSEEFWVVLSPMGWSAGISTALTNIMRVAAGLEGAAG